MENRRQRFKTYFSSFEMQHIFQTWMESVITGWQIRKLRNAGDVNILRTSLSLFLSSCVRLSLHKKIAQLLLNVFVIRKVHIADHSLPLLHRFVNDLWHYSLTQCQFLLLVMLHRVRLAGARKPVLFGVKYISILNQRTIAKPRCKIACY